MILTVHIDNREISLAAYDGEKQAVCASVGADPLATADQFAAAIHAVLAFRGLDTDAFEGAVISSVVPSLTRRLQAAASSLTAGRVLLVGAGIKTGLNLRLDSAGTVGTDFIATAIGALHGRTPPLIVAQFAGATTFTAIDRQGVLIGRSILPGVESGLEYLAQSCAQLPLVSFDPRAPLIGRGTADAMRSGALYGAVSMLDGMLCRYQQALGGRAAMVATGEPAEALLPLCAHEVEYRPHLLHDGLRLLYLKNR